ncbi:MAG: DUF1553 domain-containing protein [Planctomycetaceae bacterium]|nr:DUF1553 domain-containing protein [Planctomycetaceae bacterium]
MKTCVLNVVLMLTAMLVHPVKGADRVSFNHDVRPILSDKCFFCHGPDSERREADLRLDDRAAAIEAGAINVNKPDASELIRRVLSTDEDEQMPPPSAKLGHLSPQEIETLKAWIEQGAVYENHWAFVPLKPLPETDQSVTSLIDEAVERGLEKRGLTRQPEADRHTLIRRLSFDLTGLPPTPEDIETFVSDKSPEAYEHLVDRLLTSTAYGEKMAVDWLDIARYADSYGFQVDREREMWPWRDWVIRAFNENKPFDQFLTEQLAGDLLPDATQDQILATAFNRLHQQESEGGSVEEEYRVEYVCDRVQTFATAFLGLTFECSRCHDHKYDPITQKEYYQLFAMFQNIDEAGLYSFFTNSPPTPALELTDAATRERLDALQQKVEAIEKSGKELKAARAAVFDEWVKTQSESLSEEKTTLPGELARFPLDEVTGGKLANTVQADQLATLAGGNQIVPGRTGNAVQFSGDDALNLPLGNFGRHEPFSVSLWLQTPDVKDRAVVFHRSRAWTDAASRGYELLIEEGRLKWSLIHFWPGNAISIRAVDPVPVGEWLQVTVTYDGSSRADGLTLYVNGQPARVDVIKDNLTKEITGGGGDNITLGERFRDRGFKEGLIDDFRVFGRELTALEATAIHDEVSAESLLSVDENSEATEDRNQQFEWYLSTIDEEWAKHLKTLQESRAEWYQAADGVKGIMVMRELPEPKPAYVLFRGEYTQRREEVFAGTPAALSPFPEDAPRNRLGLAQWLIDPQHPLTARVTVNRIWQSLFGRGIVQTAEDFGSQGARPSYPEVLDTLSAGFISSGWDVKQLLKTIVMSQTYRQRSIADKKVMEDDPGNEWLARGPRFRLSAEMIRDNALASAGLLVQRTGGPPVNPYELSESFKPAAASGGDGVYRRSLYTRWRRTGPPPAMIAFDAPRRAVCTAKRERTDSPLQALVLLNGEQYVEAARVLGEHVYLEADGDVPGMIEAGFLRCLSRRPDASEVEILSALYREQLEYFRQHSEGAEQLLKIGRAPRDAAIPVAEAAAATVLAQALLNHDASVVKR